MSRYPLGQPVRISTTVRDLTGALVDPGAISLIVQRPTGTPLTYSSPAHDSLGLYHQDIPSSDLVTVGRYVYYWVTTGTGAGVPLPAALDIYDPAAAQILYVNDLKTQLGIPATDTTKDDELATFAAAAGRVVEGLIGGPWLNTTITEPVTPSGGGRILVLSKKPVVSVTSITDMQSGTASSVTGLVIDNPHGIVTQKNGVPFYWVGPYTVVYVAGHGTSVPEDVMMAGRLIGQHLWETRRGAVTRPSLGGQEIVTTSAGYAVPRRALELLGANLEEAVVG